MLDSAATQCCIARRCVSSSPILKRLPLKPYIGEPLLDANRRPLAANYVISVQFVAGTPSCSISVDMVVVDDLPYSCIVGTSLLAKVERWGVDNVKSTLHLDAAVIPVYDVPQHDERITLISSGKVTLEPGESKTIKTVATGPGMVAFRPVTEELWMYEGLTEREERSCVRVSPAVNVIGSRNDNVVLVKVTNTSNQRRAIGKRTKIAQAHKDFSEIVEDGSEMTSGAINSIRNIDVVEYLCDRSKYPHLSEEQYDQVKQLVTEFRDVFTISSETMGCANNNYFHIDITNISPIAVPIRRVPLHKEGVVRDLIDRYLELGIIEEVDSPFRAPMVLVEKKNVGESVTDRYRLAVDYRALNPLIPDSAWPAPSVDHCLDAAAGSVYLSKLDFNNGYYQIPCTDSAKRALAFSPGVGFKQYTFNGMPNGAKSAASVFQQTMEKTFQGLEECILPPYYDDVNVKGRTYETHLKNARRVLQRIKDCGFTLNALKCSLFQKRVKYLGHVVENGTVSVDPERVSKIQSIPVPRDTKSLRRFIGMVQWCSRFLPRLNDTLSPLTNLLRKGSAYDWTPECQTAFDSVKNQLSKPPVLRSPTAFDDFILETDASDTGIGGCLKILSPGSNMESLVGFHSEKFDDQHKRWHIVEKEAFSILQNVQTFKHYLIGKRFTLRTDNRILTYMKTSKSKKLANWALQLSDFNFDIVHIPSSDNRISDFFSRIYEHVCIVSELSPALSSDHLRAAQEADKHLHQAVRYVNGKKNFDVEKLGPLKRYRKFLKLDENGVLLWKTKVVLPAKFQHLVLGLAHDHPAAGHFAEDRTWKNVTSKFFWPGAHDDVVNWVRSCKACNEHAIRTYVKRPLQPIPTEGRFELVCYDLAGPFIPSKREGNLYALVVVDHFSKWPEIMALKNIRASTIASAIFEQWCCRYGIMTQLHSDGANNVHGEVMKALCSKIGSVKSKSSRLHPQGDGMAEAVVKMLKNAISKQVDQHGSDWDQYLQATAFAVRSSINNSTNCTPAELVLGSNPVRPIDVSTSEGRDTFAERQAHDFAVELAGKLDDASKTVHENLRKAREKMKTSYDKKVSHHQIKVGDHVMLWWPYRKKGIPRSFQPKWKGPFKVSAMIDDTNCTLVMDDGSMKHVHLNQLKPVEVRGDCSTSNTTPAATVSNDNDMAQLFVDLCEDESDGEPSEYETADEDTADVEGDDAWCGLNRTNIVGSRTRSGIGGGGG